jgi:hypothetical protein
MSEEEKKEGKEPGGKEGPVDKLRPEEEADPTRQVAGFVSTVSGITNGAGSVQLAKQAIGNNSAIAGEVALAVAAEDIGYHAGTNSAHVENLNPEGSTAGTAMAAPAVWRQEYMALTLNYKPDSSCPRVIHSFTTLRVSAGPFRATRRGAPRRDISLSY